MLLWCDGFDHYGDTETFMTDGSWAAVDGGWTLSTVQARTGSRSVLSSGTISTGIRRVFGSALVTAGVGAAWYFNNLPTNNGAAVVSSFRDAANDPQIEIVIQTTGAIAAYRGDAFTGTVLGTSSTLMTANAWNHIETRVKIDNSTGTVEVRLNGVTVLNLVGVDTQATAFAETSQWSANNAIASGASHYIDDVYAWDTSGVYNNDFIGDQRVWTQFPNADTAENDWVPSTGTQGFAMIDESPPNDDTDYIEAATIPESSQAVSEFELDNLPAGISSISGIMVLGRAKKTDAGTCNVMNSIVSGASDANGLNRPMTTAYTYWGDVFETDPNTAAPWTPTNFNAAKVRFTRTA